MRKLASVFNSQLKPLNILEQPMRVDTEKRNAPELRVNYWIDGEGNQSDTLTLKDLGGSFKLVFCFQHWCPGCHSYGFPTLKYLYDNMNQREIGFAVIQTVFEGESNNTVDKLRINQAKYDLKIPFGHDLPSKGESFPTIMADYQTRGTPWFLLINPEGSIVYSDFNLDVTRFIDLIDKGGMPFS